jgi:acyl dehydratase
MTDKPILYVDFPVGQAMGDMTETPTDAQCEKWAKLFPWDAPSAELVPAGMATVLMMRAYLQVVSPRPPGNLHARQQMRLHDPIRRGEAVTTSITCASKELKGERRMVVLNAQGRGEGGRLLFDGVITLYWAA